MKMPRQPELDVDLIRRARDGSSEALSQVFRQVGDKLQAVIRFRIDGALKQRIDPGDVLQATMLKAFENIDQFDGNGPQTLVGWMARIAQNELRDQAVFHGRDRRDVRRNKAIDTHFDLAAKVRSQASLMILRQETERLNRALGELDAEQREVVLMRKYEELSFREIGERLGRSPDACRMLLARALARLTRAMQAQ